MTTLDQTLPVASDFAPTDGGGSLRHGARPGRRLRRRRRLVLGTVLCADVAGVLVAFAVTAALGEDRQSSIGAGWLAVSVSIAAWALLAKAQGLYDGRQAGPARSTLDDVRGIFRATTIGMWLALVALAAAGASAPDHGELVVLWVTGTIAIAGFRGLVETGMQRSTQYREKLVILGAGEVGQLIARKIRQHPEYGLDLVGFVDDAPRERRDDLRDVPMLGGGDRLGEIVEAFEVDRVIVAFSEAGEQEKLRLVRAVDGHVRVDLVPRLFEAVTPNAVLYSVEAFPLLGVPTRSLSPAARMVKRAIDVAIAMVTLILIAPLLVVVALLIRRSSEGPVFYRQTRLGLGMREFTALKFRTMHVHADDSVHREYIRRSMDRTINAGDNGIFKLDRGADVTRIGRCLRRTSLDELPQLINVLRGDMSLVGPRPCIPYETEHFEPHHFERFTVPAGMTGLWQVKARARATFAEALDMDVAYARAWSLSLDLRLLCLTPMELLRQRGTA